MSDEDRRDNAGRLLGPASPGRYLKWRQARDEAIRNPRRVKTIKAESAEKPVAFLCCDLWWSGERTHCELCGRARPAVQP